MNALKWNLVFISTPPEKARPLGREASFPSSRPGLGDCDVTGRMFKSKMNNQSMLHSLLKYKHAAEMLISLFSDMFYARGE